MTVDVIQNPLLMQVEMLCQCLTIAFSLIYFCVGMKYLKIQSQLTFKNNSVVYDRRFRHYLYFHLSSIDHQKFKKDTFFDEFPCFNINKSKHNMNRYVY